MKKIVCLAVAVLAIVSARAEVDFAYEAGAEVVSAYLWRGQYNGGLSFQPDLEIGYDGTYTSLRVGAWASLGASDWMFRSGLPVYVSDEGEYEGTPNTYFVPEVDLAADFGFFGVHVGATYYQYFAFNGLEKKYSPWYQFEVTAGYNFGDLLDFPLYVNWNTMVAGDDMTINDEGEEKRAFSSYLEIGYDQSLPYDITLGAKIGMSPWRSDALYANDRFAVVNLSARLEKAWDFDACQLTLFAEGSINPYAISQDKDREFVYVKAAGDDKLYMQTLNGTVGLGIWF